MDHGTTFHGGAFVEVELPGGQSLWRGALIDFDLLVQMVRRIRPLEPLL